MIKYCCYTFSLFMFLFFIVPHTSLAESDEDFLLEQGTPPPGANDPSCEISNNQDPVILVPGSFERSAQNWSGLSPALKNKGYCVYALNYGFTHAGASTGPIEESAQELKEFVDNVLQHTGAEQVDIVGHSQGGMMPRYYLEFLEGDKLVDDLIAFVPSNHGTEGLANFERLTSDLADITSCVACQQQLTGSEFLETLNRGAETQRNVSYTVITTKTDQVVTPYTSAFLEEENNQVSNITIQDYNPFNLLGHQGIVYDPSSYPFVYDALANEGPADAKRALMTQ